MDRNVYMPIEILQSFMRDTFIKIGVPPEEAGLSSEVLISADLTGVVSHGISRLKYYYDRFKTGQHLPVTNLEIVRESPTTAVIDGHHGVGMVIASRSMKMAIEKAHTFGMGSVAVRNSTHFGICGYYARMAIEAGMIGMVFTQARPAIAPTFGVQPMLGTNPICFGAPTDEEFPFLYDAATSIKQRGTFEVYAREKKPGLKGWVIRQDGHSETDPTAVMEGLAKETTALLPLGGAGEELGGHKGYGLATMVEILSASLQAGSFLYGLIGFDQAGKRQPFKIGHFFLAIKIEDFTSLVDFKHTTGEILRELRASRKAPGCQRIYTPGEKEFEMEKLVRKKGIQLVPDLQKEIKTIQDELVLNQYRFPF